MSELKSVTEWYIRMGIFGIMIGTEFRSISKANYPMVPSTQTRTGTEYILLAWIVTPAWAPLVATLVYSSLGHQWRPVFIILALIGMIPLPL